MKEELKKQSEPETRKLTAWEKAMLCQAIEYLSKAVATSIMRDSTFDVQRDVNQAMGMMNEYLGSVRPAPEINEDEAEVARNLHAYTRKVMDDSLSIILYRMITEDRSRRVWLSFVKTIARSKDYRAALRAAKQAAEDGTTDDLIMCSALEMWEEDFHYAMEWIGLTSKK